MSDTVLRIVDLNTIGAEEYAQKIVQLPASKRFPPKARRNFVKKLLENREAAAIIHAAVDAIIECRLDNADIVLLHLDLLSRRRNTADAMKLCCYVNDRGDFARDVVQHAKILECQTLIQNGDQQSAQDILASRPWSDGDENPALNGLLSWLYMHSDNKALAENHFSKSNAKHLRALGDGHVPSERISSGSLQPNSIKIFTTTYNEIELIDIFLQYYRKLGDVEFVVIDNNSTDGTFDFLSKQSDVMLWRNFGSFNDSHFGSAWVNEVSTQVTRSDEICIRVDADELLVYPGIEKRSIQDFIENLNTSEIDIGVATLIDMYPADLSFPLVEDGMGIIRDSIFFDDTIRSFPDFYPPYVIHRGGVRERLFEVNTYLTKTPIFRGGGAIRYLNANHTTTPGRVSAESMMLLHYKFTPNAISRYAEQIERGEHYNAGGRYRKFIKLLNSDRRDIRSEVTRELDVAAKILNG